jgi:hypothetical protein
MNNLDERFIDADHDDEPLQGYDPKGLRADVATRWSSACLLFESAAGAFAVLNDVLMKTDSYDLFLTGSEISRIKIIAKLYRVSSTYEPRMMRTKRSYLDLEATFTT